MKINSLIKAFSMLLIVAFAACSDFEDVEVLSPEVPASNPGARFAQSNATSLEFDLSQNPNPSFIIKVNRNDDGGAASYPLTVVVNEENAYIFPESVSFDAGEKTADLVVGTTQSAPTGVPLKYHIALGENSNPYLNEYGDFYGEATLINWVKYSDGEYTSGYFGQTWSQALYNAGGTNRYRFFDLFAEGVHYEFTWIEGEESIIPGGTLTGDYYVQESGYVHSTYGMVSTSTDPSPTYTYYDEDSKTFFIDRQWNVSAGSFGWLTDIYKITE